MVLVLLWPGERRLLPKRNLRTYFRLKKAFQGVENLKGFFVLYIREKQTALRRKEKCEVL